MYCALPQVSEYSSRAGSRPCSHLFVVQEAWAAQAGLHNPAQQGTGHHLGCQLGAGTRLPCCLVLCERLCRAARAAGLEDAAPAARVP